MVSVEQTGHVATSRGSVLGLFTYIGDGEEKEKVNVTNALMELIRFNF